MTTQGGAGARASPTCMLRVDGLCDRFEAAWAGAARPRIEDFLEGLGDAEAGTAFRELLALELALRRAGGEEPSPADYRSRFPARAPAVDSAFEAGPTHEPTQIVADPHGATNTTFAIDGPGPIELRPGPVPEGYELLEVIGRGGMGVVYRARQVRLNRLVALKMVSAGGYASQEARLRFLAEAESIARLRHANVVQVYDRGECEGLPFYSMEYFAAGSLSGRVDGTPWPAIAAARTLEQVARGVAEAHRLGIIHRDLKPANILLADDGTPKAADFGLAKSLESGSDLTRTDRVLGTPSYMAPEQAEGHTRTTGRAADLYSLGAIFYELITGRPPFKGATALETLAQVRTAEPVPPSRLVPGLARDSETIAMKCLRKEPARRYASALDLAEDLRRFAVGEVIVARRAGPLEHGWKWAKRRPVMAALSAAVLLLAVGSTIAAIGIARVAAREAQARGALRHTLYVTRMNLASQAWDDANIERLRELLVPYRAGSGDEDLRGFEWYLWWDRLHSPRIHPDLPGHAAEVLSLAFSLDGATLATASADGTAKLWNVDRGTAERSLPIRSMVDAAGLAFHGRTLAAQAEDGALTLWDAESDAVKVRLPTENDWGSIRFLAFSPDGRSLLAFRDAPIQIELWDVANARLDRVLPRKPEFTTCAAVSSDGRTWAAGFMDGRISLLDLATGSPGRRLDHPDHSPIRSLSFSPDGRTVATASRDRSIKLWDATTGELRTTLYGHAENV
jgi:eukaryotic-like serine/threonine-protein kinase